MSSATGIEGVKITPFNTLSFNTISLIAIDLLDEGNIISGTKYRLNPTFTIISSYNFNSSDKEKIANAITVGNVDKSIVTKSWKGNNLNISFSKNLNPESNYSISISKSIGIDGASIKSFEPLGFTTMSAIKPSIVSANTNVIVDNRYRLNPKFTITPNYSLNSNERAIFADCISINGNANNIMSKSWNSDHSALNIEFSQNLTANTAYTLSMSQPSIDGISITPFDSVSFTTLAPITFSVVDSDNIVTDNLYKLNPVFTVNTDYDFSSAEQTAISNAISVSNVASNNINKEWNGRSLTISFKNKLSSSTSYTLSMAQPSGIDGISVEPFANTSFTTIGTANATIASVEGNILTGELYKLNPAFVVTPNVTLSSAEKANYASAITVSNVATNNVVKTWNNDNTLTIDFNQKLSPNTSYTISMAQPNGIESVDINPFSNLSFTTIGTISFAIADYTDGGYKNVIAEYDTSHDYEEDDDYDGYGDLMYGYEEEDDYQLYRLNPKFKVTVTTDYELTTALKAAIVNAVSINKVATATWNNNVLTLGLNELTPNTNYTLNVSSDEIATTGDSKSFTTLGELTLNIVCGYDCVNGEDGVAEDANPMETGRNPHFDIRATFAYNGHDGKRYRFTDDEWEIIKNAISLYCGNDNITSTRKHFADEYYIWGDQVVYSSRTKTLVLGEITATNQGAYGITNGADNEYAIEYDKTYKISISNVTIDGVKMNLFPEIRFKRHTFSEGMWGSGPRMSLDFGSF